MRDPGFPVPLLCRRGDDGSRLETRYIPKENQNDAQVYHNESRCVHGWMMMRSTWFGTPSLGEAALVGPARAGDVVRVRVGELLLLRSRLAPEEVRFLLWTPHKSRECRAERNTPTWWLTAGLPKQFHVTDLQTDARCTQQTATEETNLKKFEMFNKCAKSLRVCAHTTFKILQLD